MGFFFFFTQYVIAFTIFSQASWRYSHFQDGPTEAQDDTFKHQPSWFHFFHIRAVRALTPFSSTLSPSFLRIIVLVQSQTKLLARLPYLSPRDMHALTQLPETRPLGGSWWPQGWRDLTMDEHNTVHWP